MEKLISKFGEEFGRLRKLLLALNSIPPRTNGAISRRIPKQVQKAHGYGALVAVAKPDLLAFTLLITAWRWGADIVIRDTLKAMSG